MKINWKAIAFYTGVVVVAVLLIITFIKDKEADKWYNEHLVLKGKLEVQTEGHTKYVTTTENEKAELRIERDGEKKVRVRLEEDIAGIRASAAVDKRKLIAEKKKTATLPPDEIVIQVNERIGDETTLMEAGFFKVTRKGMNKTLDRFKDGEFNLAQWEKVEKAFSKCGEKNKSFDTTVKNLTIDLGKTQVGWDKCKGTLKTSLEDNEALEKTLKAAKWGATVKGIGGVTVVVVVLKLLKVF